MEGLTKKYDTSPKSSVPGAVPGVGFMLIASVLCLSYQFGDCSMHILHNQIFKDCHCVPFDKKLASLTNYREKQSFPWPLVVVYISRLFER